MFTIHAGEYLVGLYVQQRLGLNVWIPAKDTGIDLLVTDHENRRTVSLQAKYGKDFLPGKSAADTPKPCRPRSGCRICAGLPRSPIG